MVRRTRWGNVSGFAASNTIHRDGGFDSCRPHTETILDRPPQALQGLVLSPDPAGARKGLREASGGGPAGGRSLRIAASRRSGLEPRTSPPGGAIPLNMG